jgi:hypothetical protein
MSDKGADARERTQLNIGELDNPINILIEYLSFFI